MDYVFDIAMEYVFASATCVASERLFSIAGLVATQRSSRLAPNRLSMLTYLRSVKKEFWFKL